MKEETPITLITGFLGAGKTTLLNALLRHPGLGRTAVIVNEFGEIGLDHDLVVSTSDEMILLQSGCLCCALRGDLIDMLLELAERRAAGELAFERVVIETTGLADPTPILHSFITSPELVRLYALDGVIAVADAAAGRVTLERHEEARRQIAFADLVLLTKTDLAAAGEAEALRHEIRALNPSARLVEARNGAVDPEELTGLGHYDPAMKSEAAQAWLKLEAVPPPIEGETDPERHLGKIRSVSWIVEEPISPVVFDLWMLILTTERGPDLLRFKGIIHVQGAPHPFVVHGVQHIFHPPVPLTDWAGEDRRSRLVMILRDFTDPDLQRLFAALGALPIESRPFSGSYFPTESFE